jgi:TusA-related sulfurtransferase
MAWRVMNDSGRMNLLGVPCPVNWARAKSRLEALGPGDVLEVLVDDPKAIRDIPGAAEAEGWAVLDVTRDGPRALIRIEK